MGTHSSGSFAVAANYHPTQQSDEQMKEEMPLGVKATTATAPCCRARGDALILIVILAGHPSPASACSSRPHPGGIIVPAASSGSSWSLDRGIIQIMIEVGLKPLSTSHSTINCHL